MKSCFDSAQVKRPDDYEYLCNLVPELKTELKERETRIEAFQTEMMELKRRLKKKDDDIGKLQREIHKLKVRTLPLIHCAVTCCHLLVRVGR